MPTLVMPALMPYAAPVREGDSALVRVLEAYIETLRAENEILGRRLAAAEARAAQRERCPWWCRRQDRPQCSVQHQGERRNGSPVRCDLRGLRMALRIDDGARDRRA